MLTKSVAWGYNIFIGREYSEIKNKGRIYQMKKLFAVLLTIAMLLSMTACGSGKAESSNEASVSAAGAEAEGKAQYQCKSNKFLHFEFLLRSN